MNKRSEALAARLEAGGAALAALRVTFSKQNGIRAYPKTDARLASWCITLPA